MSGQQVATHRTPPLRGRRGTARGLLRRPHAGGLPLLCLGGLLLLAGCGATEEVAEEQITVPDADPLTMDDLPDANEEAELVVEDGDLGVDQLILLEDEPTILTLVNRDGEDYLFRIVDGLLSATPLPANETVDVSFTTPEGEDYEGQLLDPDTEEVVDTVAVLVQEPTGNVP